MIKYSLFFCYTSIFSLFSHHVFLFSHKLCHSSCSYPPNLSYIIKTSISLWHLHFFIILHFSFFPCLSLVVCFSSFFGRLYFGIIIHSFLFSLSCLCRLLCVCVLNRKKQTAILNYYYYSIH
jgi:hypothetical protein